MSDMPSPSPSPSPRAHCVAIALGISGIHDVASPSARSHRRTRSRALLADAFELALLLLPPAVVVSALSHSRGHVLLFACQIAVALAGLELSWWHFRIRKRLLVALLFDPDARISPSDAAQLQRDEMNGSGVAIAPLARRLCGGHVWVAALLTAALVGGLAAGVVLACREPVERVNPTKLGWQMFLSCVAVGAALSALCSCFAVTTCDAFVVVVYQGCFTASSLNTFLVQYDHLIALYVVLIGTCIVIIGRIVANSEVLETMLAITLDMIGLALLALPMMEIADFLGHPKSQDLGDKISAFWIVICAAEIGHFLFVKQRARLARALGVCVRPLTKRALSLQYDVEDLVFSSVFGAVGFAVSWLAYPEHLFETWEFVVLSLAVVLSQFCRLAVDAMKSLAIVDQDGSGAGDDRGRSQALPGAWLRSNGVVARASPYLLSVVMFHPYIKSLFKLSA
ncbi:hypothetical protein PybrP1_004094 [[Pythium] brassicae (nom. inval.)]|nr:hypothetical protein PybrP1_004094 [[Pythium] brassicae (nom. inval.)]